MSAQTAPSPQPPTAAALTVGPLLDRSQDEGENRRIGSAPASENGSHLRPPPGPSVTPAGSTAAIGCPQCIGEYEVLGELGRGMFGVVYRARDTRLHRDVAIKVLLAGAEADGEELIRFHAEVEALGSLQHANIVQIHDTGFHQGAPYLVMELVEGGSLSSLMHGRPRQPREAAQLIETLARAVHAAHEKGIVHRDLKPANVLLTRDGSPKITDFGLVKRMDRSLGLSQTGEAIGTPSYMAPEQASGRVHEIGPPADIYSLGSILYELLTGRPPFRGTDVLAVLDQVRSSDPISPSRLVPRLPRDLCTICLKCLEKEPRKRYASALALADDLGHFLAGEDIVARPTGRLESIWKFVRRHPWQTALAVAAVAVVILGSLLFIQDSNWKIAEFRRQRDEAERESEIATSRMEREEEENRRRFMEREHQHSLKALDGILKLVLAGKLRSNPALLQQELLVHYRSLIDRQQGSALVPREKLAEAGLGLGQLIGKTGQLDDALAVLDQAEQLSRQADGESASRQLALILLQRGRIYSEKGRDADARKDYLAALEKFEGLLKRKPADAERQRDLAEALHELAVLRSQQESDDPEVMKLFARALQLRECLCGPAATLDDLRDLARTHGFLGDVYRKLGRLTEADLAYWQSHRLRQRVDKEGKDPYDARFQLARSYANFAYLHTRGGTPATALHFLAEAEELARELVTKAPEVAAYQTELAKFCCGQAELLTLMREKGDPRWKQRSLELARKAEQIYREQGNIGKTREIRLGLARALVQQARVQVDEPDFPVKPLLSAAGTELDTVLKERQDADALFHRAATFGLYFKHVGEESRERTIKKALDHLDRAMQARFSRFHPNLIRQDRAFQEIRNLPEFEKALSEVR